MLNFINKKKEEEVMLKLNTKKINDELERMRYGRKWLAKQLGVSLVMLSYVFKKRPINYAEKIGKVFNISAKDFIIEEK